MIKSIGLLANNSFSNNKNVQTNSVLDHETESQYLANNQVAAEAISRSLAGDTVDISNEAMETQALAKQNETNKSSRSDEEPGDLIDQLIEELQEKIEKVKQEIAKVVGDSESAQLQRKALETQMMVLHSQLLTLVNKKAEALGVK